MDQGSRKPHLVSVFHHTDRPIVDRESSHCWEALTDFKTIAALCAGQCACDCSRLLKITIYHQSLAYVCLRT